MKTYFNRSAFLLCGALIVYVVYELYDKNLSPIISSSALPTENNLWIILLAETLGSLLIVTALIRFILFMKDCNKNRLFTVQSSSHLQFISVILIIYGITEYIINRLFDGESSLSFAIAIFIATICMSFSKIFKKATETKMDNDLTI
ncbi:MAG: DUF2975 domain-containing protein [Nonlabens sp.]